MADITAPRLDPDGTHIIPVTGIHRPGGTPNEDSVGEIRWSRRDGVTFWFQAPLTSASVFGAGRPKQSGGAGSVSALSFEPEWLARVEDGSAVCIYATNERTTTNATTGWDVHRGGRAESSQRVEGAAGYVEVGLHRDSPLAFWHETPVMPRLYSPGWTMRGWPEEEPYEYEIGGTTFSTTKRSLPLGGACNRRLIAAAGRNTTLGGPGGVWLTYDANGDAKPFWFPDSCERVRSLMSVLLSRHVAFVWRDTPTAADRLSRLYFGWHKGVDTDHPRSQLVPVYGSIASLTHGHEVTERLVGLDAQFAELSARFDLGWIMSSLWTAEEDFVDNQLALACVALERLSAAYQDHIVPTGLYSKKVAIMSAKQRKAVLRRLRAAMKEISATEGLTPDATSIVGTRIDNLFQPTNNDRLVMVFEELGIPLNESERAVIENRNRSLHGQKTLADGGDTAQCDAELQRYDTLRTLIGRAILHLLGYDAHYIDYSARPERGNFPLRLTTLPAVNDPPVPPEEEADDSDDEA